MKKVGILSVFAAGLGAFLMFAGCFGPFTQPEDVALSSVYYDEVNGTLTMAINGNKLPPEMARVAASRAMSDSLAQMAQWNYEVVFQAPITGGNGKIVKETWIRGQAVSVYDVYTTSDGVDYGKAAPAAATDGAAILFVGRQEALLGVGTLVSQTNRKGPGKVDAILDNDTLTVTFAVSALTGGAGFTDASSTFKLYTADWASAKVTEDNVKGFGKSIDELYPAYQVANNEAVFAGYTIGAHGGDIDDYLPGIKIRSVANTRINAAIPSNSVSGSTFPENRLDLASADIFNGNSGAAGTAFVLGDNLNKDIRFKLVTKDEAAKKGYYAFNFQICVSPITDDGTTGTWYIRNGFGINEFLLDDGRGGDGGAILLGINNPDGIGVGSGFGKPEPATGIARVGVDTSFALTTGGGTGSRQLSVSFTPVGSSGTVSWTSSNAAVATVTPGGGQVVAAGTGNATITAQLDGATPSAATTVTWSVTVSAAAGGGGPTLNSFTLNRSGTALTPWPLTIGASTYIQATISTSDGTSMDVVWTWEVISEDGTPPIALTLNSDPATCTTTGTGNPGGRVNIADIDGVAGDRLKIIATPTLDSAQAIEVIVELED